MIGLVLVSCAAIGALTGAWRGYAVAREAIAPLVRRLAISIGWIAIALYGLFLASVGLEMRG
jgi:hypothetical protein